MSEFGFIESVRKAFAAIPDNGFEGIGDDCAVYPVSESESLLFTADMLGEGIHFLRHAATPYEIGAKSLMVNLSDIAAMGGKPVATLLSLGVTADAAGEWAQEFMRGYRDVSERFGVALIGGDTTIAEERVSVNVTAIGRVLTKNIKRRSDARTGDIIMVGGRLGASAAGLQDILAGNLSTPEAVAHRNPAAQVEEGQWLGSQECVHAMMDISDGTASDLRHILEASGVGAEVETDLIPTDTTLENALCGGEDYKLLFTVASEHADDLVERFRQKFGSEIYPIGRIVQPDGSGSADSVSGSLSAPEIVWLQSGIRIHPDWHGFTHF